MHVRCARQVCSTHFMPIKNNIKDIRPMDNMQTVNQIPAWLTEVLPSTRHLHAEAEGYWLSQSWADNTLRGYRAALEHFRSWSGIHNPFPTTPEFVIAYLDAHAHKLSPTTLSHRMAAISFAHRLLNTPDPTQNTRVRGVLRGIHRTRVKHNGWQKQQVPALTLEELFLMSTQGCLDDLRSIRDRCYLLLGFFGAFRQSELSHLTLAQLTSVEEGLVISMGSTKTDPCNENNSRKVLLKGVPGLCPLEATQHWLEQGNITQGVIFRSINRRGVIGHSALSHPAANRIIKERARAVGIEQWEALSTHSLRAGFITLARELDAQDWQIMRQTHHRDQRTLNTYNRPQSAFKGNALAIVMRHVDAHFR